MTNIAKMVQDDIYALHYSTTVEDYRILLRSIMAKWDSMDCPALKSFKKDYFLPYWINSIHSKWQICHTPAGWASTNNPDEAFNKQIKSHHTKYHKLSVIEFLSMCIKVMVPYYSINKKEFKLYREPDKEVVSKANELEADWFTKDPHDPSRVQFYDQEMVYLLDIGEYKSCSCVSFQDKFTCKHLVAASSIFDFELAGYTKPRHFNIKMKRGRRKRAGPAYEKD